MKYTTIKVYKNKMVIMTLVNTEIKIFNRRQGKKVVIEEKNQKAKGTPNKKLSIWYKKKFSVK